MAEIGANDQVTMLYLGNCLEVLPTLPEKSVDAVVTDPPFGLEFMSVAWDSFAVPKGAPRTPNTWADYGSKEHPRDATSVARINRNKARAFQVFSERWAHELLRVLKPGGYAIIWGGERTYHRMACAVEDAGFVVRFMLVHINGQGFPKSARLNRDPKFCRCGASARNVGYRGRVQRHADHSDMVLVSAGSGPLFAGALRSSDIQPDFPACCPPDRDYDGVHVPSVQENDRASALQLRHAQEHIRSSECVRVRAPESSHTPSRALDIDHPSSRDCSGQSVAVSRAGSCIPVSTPHRFQIGLEASSPETHTPSRDDSLFPLNTPSAEFSLGFPRCPICGKPIADGWGSQLKPSASPILLAQKPLSEATIAANVLRWGVGALNIDGCRIPTADNLSGGAYAAHGNDRYDGSENWRFRRTGEAGDYRQPTGRWPSNWLLQHSPGCKQEGTRRVPGRGSGAGAGSLANGLTLAGGATKRTPFTGYADPDGLETVPNWLCVDGCPVRLLDIQAGPQKSGGTPRRRMSPKTSGIYGEFRGQENPDGIGSSSGNVSRFFMQFATEEAEGPAPFIYCAKAGTSERELGLDDAPVGGGDGVASAVTRRNSHPT